MTDETQANGWDGMERRAASLPIAADVGRQVVDAIAHVSTAPAPFTPATKLGFFAALGFIAALLLVVLISQFRLADRQTEGEAKNKAFRDSIVCFVVESFGQNDPADPSTTPAGKNILSRCGFITVPGNE